MLKDQIFPNCEKLGQTIIFVRTREAARQLHRQMEADGYKVCFFVFLFLLVFVCVGCGCCAC